MKKPNLYISISNFDRIYLAETIKACEKQFPNYNITYFKGGKYTDEGIKNATTVVVVIPYNLKIGRGVLSEINCYYEKYNLYPIGYSIQNQNFVTFAARSIKNPPDWNNYAEIHIYESLDFKLEIKINKKILLI